VLDAEITHHINIAVENNSTFIDNFFKE